MIHKPEECVWYIEVHSDDGEEFIGSGSAAAIRISDGTEAKNYLLTCSHVLREDTVGCLHAMQVYAWASGTNYLNEVENKKKMKVCWELSPPHKTESTTEKDILGNPKDWVLLTFEDDAQAVLSSTPVVKIVEEKIDFQPKKLVGYPDGTGNFEDGTVVPTSITDGFTTRNCGNNSGLLKFVGTDSRSGMSGGGYFGDDGRLLGIHQARIDAKVLTMGINSLEIVQYVQSIENQNYKVINSTTYLLPGSPPPDINFLERSKKKLFKFVRDIVKHKDVRQYIIDCNEKWRFEWEESKELDSFVDQLIHPDLKDQDKSENPNEEITVADILRECRPNSKYWKQLNDDRKIFLAEQMCNLICAAGPLAFSFWDFKEFQTKIKGEGTTFPSFSDCPFGVSSVGALFYKFPASFETNFEPIEAKEVVGRVECSLNSASGLQEEGRENIQEKSPFDKFVCFLTEKIFLDSEGTKTLAQLKTRLETLAKDKVFLCIQFKEAIDTDLVNQIQEYLPLLLVFPPPKAVDMHNKKILKIVDAISFTFSQFNKYRSEVSNK